VSQPSPVSQRLSRVAPARWQLSLCAAAGEAGGGFVASRSSDFRSGRGAATDPERARAESARRARTRVRRYCAANGLSRFGTLTYGRRSAPIRSSCAATSPATSGGCGRFRVRDRCRMCGCRNSTPTASDFTRISRWTGSSRVAGSRPPGGTAFQDQAADGPAGRLDVVGRVTSRGGLRVEVRE
jgi:hypothetical protein